MRAILLALALSACIDSPKPRTRGQTCPITLCGDPSTEPSWTCGDGSRGGPTGRCVADEIGVCDWEVRTCTDGAAPCVRGGCDGTVCIEAGSETLSECDYSKKLDCSWRGKCERQSDGTCGFTVDDDVERCVKFGPPE